MFGCITSLTMKLIFSSFYSFLSFKQETIDAEEITFCMMFTWEGETKLTYSCYLYGQLKLLMLPLELLSFRERACIDKACIQH